MYKFLCTNITKSKNFTNSYKKLAQNKKYHLDGSRRDALDYERLEETLEENQEPNEEENGVIPEHARPSTTPEPIGQIASKIHSIKSTSSAPSLKIRSCPKFSTGPLIIKESPASMISKKYYHVYSMSPTTPSKRFYSSRVTTTRNLLNDKAKEYYKKAMQQLAEIQKKKEDREFSSAITTEKPEYVPPDIWVMKKKKSAKAQIKYPTHSIKHNLSLSQRFKIKEGSSNKKLRIFDDDAQLKGKVRQTKKMQILMKNIMYPETMDSVRRKGKINDVSWLPERADRAEKPMSEEPIINVVREFSKDENIDETSQQQNLDAEFEELIKSHPTIKNASNEVKMKLKTRFVQLLLKPKRNSRKTTKQTGEEGEAPQQSDDTVMVEGEVERKDNVDKELDKNAKVEGEENEYIRIHPTNLAVPENQEKDYIPLKHSKRVWMDPPDSKVFDIDNVCIKDKTTKNATGMVSKADYVETPKVDYNHLQKEAEKLSTFVELERGKKKVNDTIRKVKKGILSSEMTKSKLEELKQERILLLQELENVSKLKAAEQAKLPIADSAEAKVDRVDNLDQEISELTTGLEDQRKKQEADKLRKIMENRVFKDELVELTETNNALKKELEKEQKTLDLKKKQLPTFMAAPHRSKRIRESNAKIFELNKQAQNTQKITPETILNTEAPSELVLSREATSERADSSETGKIVKEGTDKLNVKEKRFSSEKLNRVVEMQKPPSERIANILSRNVKIDTLPTPIILTASKNPPISKAPKKVFLDQATIKVLADLPKGNRNTEIYPGNYMFYRDVLEKVAKADSTSGQIKSDNEFCEELMHTIFKKATNEDEIKEYSESMAAVKKNIEEMKDKTEEKEELNKEDNSLMLKDPTKIKANLSQVEELSVGSKEAAEEDKNIGSEMVSLVDHKVPDDVRSQDAENIKVQMTNTGEGDFSQINKNYIVKANEKDDLLSVLEKPPKKPNMLLKILDGVKEEIDKDVSFTFNIVGNIKKRARSPKAYDEQKVFANQQDQTLVTVEDQEKQKTNDSKDLQDDLTVKGLQDPMASIVETLQKQKTIRDEDLQGQTVVSGENPEDQKVFSSEPLRDQKDVSGEDQQNKITLGKQDTIQVEEKLTKETSREYPNENIESSVLLVETNPKEDKDFGSQMVAIVEKKMLKNVQVQEAIDGPTFYEKDAEQIREMESLIKDHPQNSKAARSLSTAKATLAKTNRVEKALSEINETGNKGMHRKGLSTVATDTQKALEEFTATEQQRIVTALKNILEHIENGTQKDEHVCSLKVAPENEDVPKETKSGKNKNSEALKADQFPLKNLDHLGCLYNAPKEAQVVKTVPETTKAHDGDARKIEQVVSGDEAAKETKKKHDEDVRKVQLAVSGNKTKLPETKKEYDGDDTKVHQVWSGDETARKTEKKHDEDVKKVKLALSGVKTKPSEPKKNLNEDVRKVQQAVSGVKTKRNHEEGVRMVQQAVSGIIPKPETKKKHDDVQQVPSGKKTAAKTEKEYNKVARKLQLDNTKIVADTKEENKDAKDKEESSKYEGSHRDQISLRPISKRIKKQLKEMKLMPNKDSLDDPSITDKMNEVAHKVTRKAEIKKFKRKEREYIQEVKRRQFSSPSLVSSVSLPKTRKTEHRREDKIQLANEVKEKIQRLVPETRKKKKVVSRQNKQISKDPYVKLEETNKFDALNEVARSFSRKKRKNWQDDSRQNIKKSKISNGGVSEVHAPIKGVMNKLQEESNVNQNTGVVNKIPQKEDLPVFSDPMVPFISSSKKEKITTEQKKENEKKLIENEAAIEEIPNTKTQIDRCNDTTPGKKEIIPIATQIRECIKDTFGVTSLKTKEQMHLINSNKDYLSINNSDKSNLNINQPVSEINDSGASMFRKSIGENTLPESGVAVCLPDENLITNTTEIYDNQSVLNENFVSEENICSQDDAVDICYTNASNDILYLQNRNITETCPRLDITNQLSKSMLPINKMLVKSRVEGPTEIPSAIKNVNLAMQLGDCKFGNKARLPPIPKKPPVPDKKDKIKKEKPKGPRDMILPPKIRGSNHPIPEKPKVSPPNQNKKKSEKDTLDALSSIKDVLSVETVEMDEQILVLGKKESKGLPTSKDSKEEDRQNDRRLQKALSDFIEQEKLDEISVDNNKSKKGSTDSKPKSNNKKEPENCTEVKTSKIKIISYGNKIGLQEIDEPSVFSNTDVGKKEQTSTNQQMPSTRKENISVESTITGTKSSSLVFSKTRSIKTANEHAVREIKSANKVFIHKIHVQAMPGKPKSNIIEPTPQKPIKVSTESDGVKAKHETDNSSLKKSSMGLGLPVKASTQRPLSCPPVQTAQKLEKIEENQSLIKNKIDVRASSCPPKPAVQDPRPKSKPQTIVSNMLNCSPAKVQSYQQISKSKGNKQSMRLKKTVSEKGALVAKAQSQRTVSCPHVVPHPQTSTKTSKIYNEKISMRAASGSSKSSHIALQESKSKYSSWSKSSSSLTRSATPNTQKSLNKVKANMKKSSSVQDNRQQNTTLCSADQNLKQPNPKFIVKLVLPKPDIGNKLNTVYVSQVETKKTKVRNESWHSTDSQNNNNKSFTPRIDVSEGSEHVLKLGIASDPSGKKASDNTDENASFNIQYDGDVVIIKQADEQMKDNLSQSKQCSEKQLDLMDVNKEEHEINIGPKHPDASGEKKMFAKIEQVLEKSPVTIEDGSKRDKSKSNLKSETCISTGNKSKTESNKSNFDSIKYQSETVVRNKEINKVASRLLGKSPKRSKSEVETNRITVTKDGPIELTKVDRHNCDKMELLLSNVEKFKRRELKSTLKPHYIKENRKSQPESGTLKGITRAKVSMTNTITKTAKSQDHKEKVDKRGNRFTIRVNNDDQKSAKKEEKVIRIDAQFYLENELKNPIESDTNQELDTLLLKKSGINHDKSLTKISVKGELILEKKSSERLEDKLKKVAHDLRSKSEENIGKLREINISEEDAEVLNNVLDKLLPKTSRVRIKPSNSDDTTKKKTSKSDTKFLSELNNTKIEDIVEKKPPKVASMMESTDENNDPITLENPNVTKTEFETTKPEAVNKTAMDIPGSEGGKPKAKVKIFKEIPNILEEVNKRKENVNNAVSSLEESKEIQENVNPYQTETQTTNLASFKDEKGDAYTHVLNQYANLNKSNEEQFKKYKTKAKVFKENVKPKLYETQTTNSPSSDTLNQSVNLKQLNEPAKKGLESKGSKTNIELGQLDGSNMLKEEKREENVNPNKTETLYINSASPKDVNQIADTSTLNQSANPGQLNEDVKKDIKSEGGKTCIELGKLGSSNMFKESHKNTANVSNIVSSSYNLNALKGHVKSKKHETLTINSDSPKDVKQGSAQSNEKVKKEIKSETGKTNIELGKLGSSNIFKGTGKNTVTVSNVVSSSYNLNVLKANIKPNKNETMTTNPASPKDNKQEGVTSAINQSANLRQSNEDVKEIKSETGKTNIELGKLGSSSIFKGTGKNTATVSNVVSSSYNLNVLKANTKPNKNETLTKDDKQKSDITATNRSAISKQSNENVKKEIKSNTELGKFSGGSFNIFKGNDKNTANVSNVVSFSFNSNVFGENVKSNKNETPTITSDLPKHEKQKPDTSAINQPLNLGQSNNVQTNIGLGKLGSSSMVKGNDKNTVNVSNVVSSSYNINKTKNEKVPINAANHKDKTQKQDLKQFNKNVEKESDDGKTINELGKLGLNMYKETGKTTVSNVVNSLYTAKANRKNIGSNKNEIVTMNTAPSKLEKQEANTNALNQSSALNKSKEDEHTYSEILNKSEKMEIQTPDSTKNDSTKNKSLGKSEGIKLHKVLDNTKDVRNDFKGIFKNVNNIASTTKNHAGNETQKHTESKVNNMANTATVMGDVTTAKSNLTKSINEYDSIPLNKPKTDQSHCKGDSKHIQSQVAKPSNIPSSKKDDVGDIKQHQLFLSGSEHFSNVPSVLEKSKTAPSHSKSNNVVGGSLVTKNSNISTRVLKVPTKESQPGNNKIAGNINPVNNETKIIPKESKLDNKVVNKPLGKSNNFAGGTLITKNVNMSTNEANAAKIEPQHGNNKISQNMDPVSNETQSDNKIAGNTNLANNEIRSGPNESKLDNKVVTKPFGKDNSFAGGTLITKNVNISTNEVKGAKMKPQKSNNKIAQNMNSVSNETPIKTQPSGNNIAGNTNLVNNETRSGPSESKLDNKVVTKPFGKDNSFAGGTLITKNVNISTNEVKGAKIEPQHSNNKIAQNMNSVSNKTPIKTQPSYNNIAGNTNLVNNETRVGPNESKLNNKLVNKPFRKDNNFAGGSLITKNVNISTNELKGTKKELQHGNYKNPVKDDIKIINQPGDNKIAGSTNPITKKEPNESKLDNKITHKLFNKDNTSTDKPKGANKEPQHGNSTNVQTTHFVNNETKMLPSESKVNIKIANEPFKDKLSARDKNILNKAASDATKTSEKYPKAKMFSGGYLVAENSHLVGADNNIPETIGPEELVAKLGLKESKVDASKRNLKTFEGGVLVTKNPAIKANFNEFKKLIVKELEKDFKPINVFKMPNFYGKTNDNSKESKSGPKDANEKNTNPNDNLKEKDTSSILKSVAVGVKKTTEKYSKGDVEKIIRKDTFVVETTKSNDSIPNKIEDKASDWKNIKKMAANTEVNSKKPYSKGSLISGKDSLSSKAKSLSEKCGTLIVNSVVNKNQSRGDLNPVKNTTLASNPNNISNKERSLDVSKPNSDGVETSKQTEPSLKNKQATKSSPDIPSLVERPGNAGKKSKVSNSKDTTTFVKNSERAEQVINETKKYMKTPTILVEKHPKGSEKSVPEIKPKNVSDVNLYVSRLMKNAEFNESRDRKAKAMSKDIQASKSALNVFSVLTKPENNDKKSKSVKSYDSTPNISREVIEAANRDLKKEINTIKASAKKNSNNVLTPLGHNRLESKQNLIKVVKNNTDAKAKSENTETSKSVVNVSSVLDMPINIEKKIVASKSNNKNAAQIKMNLDLATDNQKENILITEKVEPKIDSSVENQSSENAKYKSVEENSGFKSEGIFGERRELYGKLKSKTWKRSHELSVRPEVKSSTLNTNKPVESVIVKEDAQSTLSTNKPVESVIVKEDARVNKERTQGGVISNSNELNSDINTNPKPAKVVVSNNLNVEVVHKGKVPDEPTANEEQIIKSVLKKKVETVDLRKTRQLVDRYFKDPNRVPKKKVTFLVNLERQEQQKRREVIQEKMGKSKKVKQAKIHDLKNQKTPIKELNVSANSILSKTDYLKHLQRERRRKSKQSEEKDSKGPSSNTENAKMKTGSSNIDKGPTNEYKCSSVTSPSLASESVDGKSSDYMGTNNLKKQHFNTLLLLLTNKGQLMSKAEYLHLKSELEDLKKTFTKEKDNNESSSKISLSGLQVQEVSSGNKHTEVIDPAILNKSDFRLEENIVPADNIHHKINKMTEMLFDELTHSKSQDKFLEKNLDDDVKVKNILDSVQKRKLSGKASDQNPIKTDEDVTTEADGKKQMKITKSVMNIRTSDTKDKAKQLDPVNIKLTPNNKVVPVKYESTIKDKQENLNGDIQTVVESLADPFSRAESNVVLQKEHKIKLEAPKETLPNRASLSLQASPNNDGGVYFKCLHRQDYRWPEETLNNNVKERIKMDGKTDTANLTEQEVIKQIRSSVNDILGFSLDKHIEHSKEQKPTAKITSNQKVGPVKNTEQKELASDSAGDQKSDVIKDKGQKFFPNITNVKETETLKAQVNITSGNKTYPSTTTQSCQSNPSIPQKTIVGENIQFKINKLSQKLADELNTSAETKVCLGNLEMDQKVSEIITEAQMDNRPAYFTGQKREKQVVQVVNQAGVGLAKMRAIGGTQSTVVVRKVAYRDNLPNLMGGIEVFPKLKQASASHQKEKKMKKDFKISETLQDVIMGADNRCGVYFKCPHLADYVFSQNKSGPSDRKGPSKKIKTEEESTSTPAYYSYIKDYTLFKREIDRMVMVKNRNKVERQLQLANSKSISDQKTVRHDQAANQKQTSVADATKSKTAIIISKPAKMTSFTPTPPPFANASPSDNGKTNGKKPKRKQKKTAASKKSRPNAGVIRYKTKKRCRHILPQKHPKEILSEENYVSTLHKPVGEKIKVVPKEILELEEEREREKQEYADRLDKYKNLRITYVTVKRPKRRGSKFSPKMPKKFEDSEIGEDEKNALINFRFELIKRLNEEFKQLESQTESTPTSKSSTQVPYTFETPPVRPDPPQNPKESSDKPVAKILETVIKDSKRKTISKRNSEAKNMNSTKVLFQIRPDLKIDCSVIRTKLSKPPVASEKDRNKVFNSMKGLSRIKRGDVGTKKDESGGNEMGGPKKFSTWSNKYVGLLTTESKKWPNFISTFSKNYNKCPDDDDTKKCSDDTTKCADDNQKSEGGLVQCPGYNRGGEDDIAKCSDYIKKCLEAIDDCDEEKCEKNTEEKEWFDITKAVPNAFEFASCRLEENRREDLYYRYNQTTFVELLTYLHQFRAERAADKPKNADQSKNTQDTDKCT